MPDLPIQNIMRSGLDAAYTGSLTAATPYNSPNNGQIFLHFKNAATAASVTIVTVTVVDGIDLSDRVVSIPANSERFVGPFPVEVYGRTLSWTAATPGTLSVAALRMM